MGTADFAVPSLRECASHHEVIAVVTQPDRPGHRGAPAPRPVRDAAAELDLRVLAPQRVRHDDTIAALLALSPDCVVVAAYGQILPPPLLHRPRHGALNVHASLLPRWRGAAPVAHAILAGDAVTGVSIMKMDEGLDTGPIYTSERVSISDGATTPALTDALAALGAELLVDVLASLEQGTAEATPQSDGGVTLAPRLRRADGELDWSRISGIDVDRHVRALQPWPGVHLPLEGVRVRVLQGAPCDLGAAQTAAPGEVVRADGEAVLVAAREGAYRMDAVLPPGSRAMSAAAFLRGRRKRP